MSEMEEAAPTVETVEGPDEKARVDAPPSWLSSKEAPEEKVGEGFEISLGGLDEIGADAVKLVHHRAAQGTGFQGWELDPEEYSLWRKILAWLFKHLPGKDYPFIIALFALVAMEGAKVYAFTQWKKGAKTEIVVKHETVPVPENPPMQGTLKV